MNVDVAASLLGVGLSANADEINAAFKYRCRLVHPDRVEGVQAKATAEEFMKQLNEAREVLLDYAANPDAHKGKSEEGSVFTEPVNNQGFSPSDVPVASFEEPVFESVEEQVERLRAERQADIDGEKYLVKQLNVMLLVNGLFLVLCSGLTVFSVVQFVTQSAWGWLVLGAVAGAGVWFFWVRLQVRFESWKKHTWLLKEYKRVARLEEKGYREVLNPKSSNGFITRLTSFFDRF